MSSPSIEGFGPVLSPKLRQASGSRLFTAVCKDLAHAEIGTSALAFTLMMMLPLAEVASRTFLKSSIGGTIPVVEHLSLWITFLGAALAARSDRLLSLATPNFLP